MTIAASGYAPDAEQVPRLRPSAFFLSGRRPVGTLPWGYRWLAALAAVVVAILVAAPSPAHADAPNVSEVTVASSSRTAATATVTVSAAGTFYLQFSLRGESQWTAVSSQIASAAGDLTFSLTGLEANAYYDVEVSESSTFASAIESATFQNRPAHLDFATGTTNPARGIAGTSQTLWVTTEPNSGVANFLAFKR